jgi:hypothetical protein
MALRAAKDREVKGQPSDYKFIGLIQGRNSPMQGVFLKGDDIDFYKIGEEATKNWKLMALNDEEAQFQNTRFIDLKFTLKAPQGGGTDQTRNQQQVTNLF